jgi:hypothetical protein
MTAFKFPDKQQVFLTCNIEVRKLKCPVRLNLKKLVISRESEKSNKAIKKYTAPMVI